MYFLKRGFLDGRHGLLLAILSANTTFTRYADLWLRDYVKRQQEAVKLAEKGPTENTSKNDFIK
jgi:(heptosyl)LPS beta-1,4-glucosyltransferase